MESTGNGNFNEFVFGDTVPERNTPTASEPAIDPTSIADSGEIIEPVKRKRGRPAGSRNAAKKEAVSLDLSGLESILVSIHFMLASVTHAPEIKLSSDEAKILSQSVANVARHYPSFVAGQKVLDWAGLITVCMGIYGAKLTVIKARKRVDIQRQNQPTIVPFNPVA